MAKCSMKKITLKHGEVVLVDDQDFEELNKYKWCLNSAGYATRRNDTHTSLLMHRVINNTPKGFHTDHINRNKLDNRRGNLRTLTSSQNHMNMPIQKNNTHGRTGIYWDKSRNKWIPRIKINGKSKYLGIFLNIEEAIQARENAERIYF